MSVRAVFKFDPSEHYCALRAVTRLTPARYYSWASLALAIVLVAWALMSLASGQTLRDQLVIILPWVVLAIIWAGIIPFTQWRLARKLSKRDPIVIGTQQRIVDSEGYHSRGNGVALDIPWHVLYKVVETDAFFLFFYNKRCAYYVPKRAISVDEVAAVRKPSRSALNDRPRLSSTDIGPTPSPS